jgi:hypothetical protein
VADKSWKAHERQIARLLGGQRLPCNGKGSPDVLTVSFVLEEERRLGGLRDDGQWIKRNAEKTGG